MKMSPASFLDVYIAGPISRLTAMEREKQTENCVLYSAQENPPCWRCAW